MNSVKIFLFTCVKDGRKYIKKLFSSLLEQTNTDFVHFIYDNGSTDPIDDLILIYKKEVAKLKKPYEVIYEKTAESVGLNMATKYCINKCDKPYFIWIDCDNWVHKNFFKNLAKEIKKHPNQVLYRTFLVKVDENGSTSSNFKQRKLSLKSKNNAAFTFFTRKNRYYYSFFAVNTKKYLELSHNNILNIRDYYNDEQILTYCYFSSDNFSMIKRSVGYYLARDNSEAHIIKPKQNFDNIFAFDERIKIAKSISKSTEDYYLTIKKLFNEYNLMASEYSLKNITNAKNHFNKLYALSRTNHFSTKVTFRNKDFLYWLLVLCLKRR